MTAITRILVPVDFSPCSQAAVDYAASLAERFDAALEVLHVWDPVRTMSPPAGPGGRAGGGARELSEFAVTEPGQAMDGVLDALEKRGLPRVRGRLATGDPPTAILDAGASDGCDLIVMGTHGRTGLARFVFGSVAEAVVRRAPCPVLTIKAAAQP